MNNPVNDEAAATGAPVEGSDEPEASTDRDESAPDDDLHLDDSSPSLADVGRDVGHFVMTRAPAFAGPVDVRGAAVVRGDQHVYLDGQQHRRTRSTAISADLIRQLRGVDAGHPSTGEAILALRRNRLCILQGSRGSGRGFVARLAAADQVDGGTCRLIEPGTAPGDLVAADFEPGCSYVLDSPEVGQDRPLAEFVVVHLTELLEERGATLTLVVDDLVAASAEAAPLVVAVADRPVRAEILRSHLRYHLPDGVEAEIDVLLGHPRITHWLAEDAPALVEVARIGAELAAGTTPEECMSTVSARASEDTRALLAAPEKPRELAIAVAFFGGFPYSTVGRLEAELADVVHIATGHEGPRPRPFLRDRQRQLEEIGAEITQGIASTDYGTSPAELVKFPRLQVLDAVIDQTWRDLDGSEVLLTWLRGLVTHTDPAVRSRAAASIGRLSWSGFVNVSENVLQPWSYSTNQRQRNATATALSVAVQDEAVAGHALGLIESWTTGSGRNRRITAALSWGLAAAPRWPSAALDGLGRLLSSSDGDAGVARAVRDGLSNVFGAHPEIVLRTLHGWWADGERVHHGEVLAAFLQICQVGRVEHSSGALPPVLEIFADALAERRAGEATGDGTSAADAVRDLWRGALNEHDTRSTALSALAAWVRQADHVATSRDAIIDLIGHIVVEERERNRLQHALRKLDDDPSEPSLTAKAALEALDLRSPGPSATRTSGDGMVRNQMFGDQ